MELWKDIEGYEGMYQVSSEGRVKSLEREAIMGRGGVYKLKERILKQHKNSIGYPQVYLKQRWYRVHRLVAEAFIENPENKTCVDHINGFRDDNRVENLRWCTQQENLSFPLAKKHKGENNYWYGKHHSDETKRKMSEAHKGENNYWYGKHHSDETKEKISEALKGRKEEKKG